MSGVIDRLANLPAPPVYAVVAVLVFAEDALFVGFVIPGETAAILGGVAASRGHVSLPTLTAAVVVAAITGDSVGYGIGARYGNRLLTLRPMRARRESIDAAGRTLARRGGPAVFLSRWLAFLRAIMPFLAGMSRMQYHKFLAYNAAGGLAWGVSSVLLGYLAGNSYTAVERTFGRATALITVLVIGIGLLLWAIHRHRHCRRQK